MTLFNTFISSVESGELPANRWVKAAVKRHKSDLKASAKGLYYFDEEEVERVLALFGMFRHTKGEYTGEFFQLFPWQAFLLGSIYGWKRKADDLRRFRKVYCEIARKNGKSELAGAIAVNEAFFYGEKKSEVYSVANKLEQAGYSWEAGKEIARQFAEEHEDLKGLIDYHDSFNNKKVFDINGSFFKPIASEAKTLDGPSPQCGIVDEYHEARDEKVLRVVQTGMGGRRQPLTVIITTAGFNRLGPCFQLRKVVCDILDGKKKDDSFFGLIFTLDEEDDWHDENVWIKANPGIGRAPYWDFMRTEYQSAKNEGETARINFLTKNLNIWTTTSKTWIKDEDWIANYEPIDLEGLKGRACYGGLDLASTRDICAFVLFFPGEDDEKHVILCWFWIPEDGATERSARDGVPYLQWIADGLIEATPGNVTDYGYIKAAIIELAQVYDIQVVGYDRFNASQLVIELQDEGMKMDGFGQGFVSMNAPTKQIEKMAMNKEMNHMGNEVLRWMCGNVTTKMDPAGNIKMDKGKSQEKIDGMVALAMAIGEWMTGDKPQGPSKYESEGFIMV